MTLIKEIYLSVDLGTKAPIAFKIYASPVPMPNPKDPRTRPSFLDQMKKRIKGNIVSIKEDSSLVRNEPIF